MKISPPDFEGFSVIGRDTSVTCTRVTAHMGGAGSRDLLGRVLRHNNAAQRNKANAAEQGETFWLAQQAAEKQKQEQDFPLCVSCFCPRIGKILLRCQVVNLGIFLASDRSLLQLVA